MDHKYRAEVEFVVKEPLTLDEVNQILKKVKVTVPGEVYQTNVAKLVY